LTVHLQRLLTDRGLARRLGDNARQRVVRDFSIEAAAAATFELYDRLRGETTGFHPRRHSPIERR
jgi:glycosyltransferase involved in cell wall biosynthesis